MIEKICQSCAMSLNEEKYFGTNTDGSKNEDYCVFCFSEGEFTYEITMNEMVEKGMDFLKRFGGLDSKNTDGIKEILNVMYSGLKRWSK
ncbi:zinc ribbon domain-containing protein [Sebaldella sp. S0638]|uniref:zinc ribbon domain-containing protein n=1 Tax=Sebaldella sp. S0638 TaxID=2957809 RepID=UPI0020A1A428|nr:zinc ribbon domain-containing protein [Sebaldella sp. S0638]MCP1222804.1 zinc ribbon domain-containing protein [Sebaldella sp. S0638]